MPGRRFGWGFSLVGLVLIVLALAGVGYLAYNAGVSQGVAQAVDLPEAELERGAPLYYAPYGMRPFGFGLFGCLIPLLLLFVLFGGMRLLFAPWRMGGWGRGWGWGGKHPERWERFRERAEQWHREMHAADERSEEPGEA